MHPLYGKADRLSAEVIGAAIEVHRHLGPGLLEGAYEECLCRELDLQGIPYLRQHPIDIEYKGDEMASGGQREHRHDALVARMKDKGLNPESFEFYLKAFRYGMPPHGGWGFGLDRFVQKLLDLPNIREAILFPRDRTRLVP